MTNLLSSAYTTLILFTLCVLGLLACFSLALDIVAIAPLVAACSDIFVGDGSSVVSVAAVGGLFCGGELDFRNLQRASENIEDYADQHNPELLVKLAKAENEQADRLEKLFNGIAANAASSKSKTTSFGYADILPWRERVRFLKNVGDAKRAAQLEKAMAVKEAKAFDSDEEFQAGYKEFLATEFNESE